MPDDISPVSNADAGSVGVIHHLRVKPGALDHVHRLMSRDYPAAVASFGLALRDIWVTPPVDVPGRGADLFVIMEYPSINLFWAERAAGLSEVPGCVAIWAEIDRWIEGRTRHLGMRQPIAAPPPDHRLTRSRLAPKLRRRMYMLRPDTQSEDARLALVADIDALAVHSLGVALSRAGPHVAHSHLPGHVTWDVMMDGRIAEHELLAQLPGNSRVIEALHLDPPHRLSAGTPVPIGFKRVILFKAMTGAEDRTDEALEWLGRSTDVMLNWSISRVDARSNKTGWTHAFEMEFAALADLAAYRNTPYHWAVADLPFHPEAPELAATDFCACFYPISRSFLSEL